MSRIARHRSARRARVALAWLLGILVISNLVLTLGMEFFIPQLRDPEYGRKMLRLQARLEEHPGRPVVLILGSSRAAMGIRPEVIETDPVTAAYFSDRGESPPLVFNYSLVGSGPLMELMCLRRLLEDGVRPDAIILEIWPPFLNQDGPQLEEHRIDLNRLRFDDLDLLRRYYENPQVVRKGVEWARWAPWYSHRFFLLSQVIPGWVSPDDRRDFTWNGLNDWGWLPGNPDNSDPSVRQGKLNTARGYYEPILQGYSVSPMSDTALHEFFDLCREHDIPLTLLILPEATEFSTWYSDAGRLRAEQYLDELPRETGIPLIDARRWSQDRYLLDGFHLTHEGATQFSLRLGREILPTLRLRRDTP